jgi:hypothetical protein
MNPELQGNVSGSKLARVAFSHLHLRHDVALVHVWGRHCLDVLVHYMKIAVITEN